MDYLRIKGAKENNLKNIDIDIPRNKLVVITGLSGSGKSSLAFNTIYAEGHRRYVESLSSYARQFLGQLEKPKAESITGLSPTIAIDQKTTSRNPRSTVGTVTEIYDYLRLMFARAGTVYCPNGQGEIKAQTVDEIVEQILELPEGTKLQILAPAIRGKKGEHTNTVMDLMKQGLIRGRIDGEMVEFHSDIKLEKNKKHTIEAVVDRVKLKESVRSRLSESVELALKIGNGLLIALTEHNERTYSKNHSCHECGFSFDEIEPRTFSFNAPYGMCHTCSGLGVTKEPNLLKILDKTKPVSDGAVHVLTVSRYYKAMLLAYCKHNNIEHTVAFEELSKREQELVLHADTLHA